MRTTLEIEDALIIALLERHPGATKTEAIDRALRAYLENDAVSQLIQLAGNVEIEDLSRELRAQDRYT